MINKVFKKTIAILLIGFVLFNSSCKKFIMVDAPTTNINEGNVYNSDATTVAVLTGLYSNMGLLKLDGQNGGITKITLYGGLSSDELILAKPNIDLLNYFSNNVKADGTIGQVWADSYNKIYVCNAAIEGITKSVGLTPLVKQHMLGEAKFIRAFCYFYLVNEFGAIPLTTATDYKVNSLLPRSSKEDVYKLILNDLIDAQRLLPDGYIDGGGVNPTMERVRPNKWAATALLARAYLYLGDFTNAQIQSSLIIEKSSFYSLVNLDEVFLKNSREAIWQLQSVIDNFNTPEGLLFTPQYSGGILSTPPVLLSSDFLSQFQNGDQRGKQWVNTFVSSNITYFYPFKYRNAVNDATITEYSMVLRLAEQYLIRAEARIRLKRIAEGISDLNILRKRASNNPNELTPLSNGLSLEDAISAVLHERQVELFTEWGHRWFDLKRLDMANDILGQIKGSNWQVTDQLYPIPQDNIDANPNLKGHQNPGYQ